MFPYQIEKYSHAPFEFKFLSFNKWRLDILTNCSHASLRHSSKWKRPLMSTGQTSDGGNQRMCWKHDISVCFLYHFLFAPHRSGVFVCCFLPLSAFIDTPTFLPQQTVKNVFGILRVFWSSRPFRFIFIFLMLKLNMCMQTGGWRPSRWKASLEEQRLCLKRAVERLGWNELLLNRFVLWIATYLSLWLLGMSSLVLRSSSAHVWAECHCSCC